MNPLTSSSIERLKRHSFLSEIDSNRGDVSVTEAAVHELVQETGFPHTRITQHQEFEQVVIIHCDNGLIWQIFIMSGLSIYILILSY